MTPFFNKRQNDLNFKLKILAEAEAVKNNREIAREYGIFKSMVHKWENQQHMLFNGKLRDCSRQFETDSEGEEGE